MTLLSTIAAFLVTLGILIVIHEYGHYWVARKCGVRVLRFSIGFGRPLVRWVSGPDRTEWVIAALPFGGYVRMLDERDPDHPVAEEDLPRTFNRQPVPNASRSSSRVRLPICCLRLPCTVLLSGRCL
jgi:regulator of sigma E protease